MTVKKHILVALVEDKPGVLNRMASIFRRRGFNIESVNVIETIDSESSEIPLTRVAIVVGGSTARLEQVRKQLDKLVDVVNVSDVPTKDTK
jgi:acetolactate synthase-1/3 small subunit|tara:strand:+ start:80 stop:352 length:273 start_codon:yes stop_codon:yes gene_type:complete